MASHVPVLPAYIYTETDEKTVLASQDYTRYQQEISHWQGEKDKFLIETKKFDNDLKTQQDRGADGEIAANGLILAHAAELKNIEDNLSQLRELSAAAELKRTKEMSKQDEVNKDFEKWYCDLKIDVRNRLHTKFNTYNNDRAFSGLSQTVSEWPTGYEETNKFTQNDTMSSETIDNAGNGNCLFYAILNYFTPPSATTADGLRTEVCNHGRQSAYGLLTFCSENTKVCDKIRELDRDDSPRDFVIEAYQIYLNFMKKDGFGIKGNHWADTTMMAIASELLGVSIAVLVIKESSTQKIAHTFRVGNNSTAIIIAHVDGNHYVSLARTDCEKTIRDVAPLVHVTAPFHSFIMLKTTDARFNNEKCTVDS